MSLEDFRRSSLSRLNYTQRRALAATAVSISVDASASPLKARIAELDVGQVADDAEVALEAYRSKSGHYQRLSFGLAKKFKQPGAGSDWAELNAIPSADGLRFRVKITEAETGKLIAEVDGVRSIEDQSERDADDLLPLRQKDLQGDVWRLHFAAEGPEIWVEKSLEASGVFLWKSPAFLALALPAAMRAIAERLVRSSEQAGEWLPRWRVFLAGIYPPFGDLLDDREEGEAAPSDEEIDAMLDELSAAFSKRHGLMQTALTALGEAPQ